MPNKIVKRNISKTFEVKTGNVDLASKIAWDSIPEESINREVFVKSDSKTSTVIIRYILVEVLSW